MKMQRVVKSCSSHYEVAYYYYSLLFRLAGIDCWDMAVRFLAYVAVHNGGVVNKEIKDKFCADHGSTVSSVNNMVSHLRKVRVFMKEPSGKLCINKVMNMDFSKGVTLLAEIKYDERKGSEASADQGDSHQAGS